MTERFTTLIDAARLSRSIGTTGWCVVDCRFSLRDPQAGRAAWRAATLPGAVYAHLDDDLSAPVVPGKTGRHPLPEPEAFAATLRGWGIDRDTQIVAFDDMGGAFAARLWWMCRWLGHESVAVLDGGLAAWQGHDGVMAAGVQASTTGNVAAKPNAAMVAHASEVLAALERPEATVLDARSADRFAGNNETTDPVAGHIAGALSAPFAGNLDVDKRFVSPATIRARFADLLDGRSSGDAICYCGSGVTACHDILAMAHVGLPLPRLYPGSWSEWIIDPARPRG